MASTGRSAMTRPRNDTFLRALLREPVPYTPIWIMRQAGRYLPEYNQTRARAGSFLDLCRDPDLATEVTLQPLSRYPLDAAIVFSDILTVPDAMGLGLYFAEGEGPRFQRPLREAREIRNLIAPDPHERLRYVLDTVAQVRKALLEARAAEDEATAIRSQVRPTAVEPTQPSIDTAAIYAARNQNVR